MADGKFDDLSKDELKQKAGQMAKQLTGRSKKSREMHSLMAGGIGRKLAQGEAYAEANLVERYQPGRKKLIHTVAGVVKGITAIGLDFWGHHNLAQALDVSMAGNAGVLGDLAARNRSDAPAPAPAPVPAPGEPPRRSGELWIENRLTGAAAPAAPAALALPAPGPMGPPRPFLTMLRNNPRVVNAVRSSLQTSGIDDSPTTLGVIADAADASVTPSTGALGQRAVEAALKALMDSAAQLQSLDRVANTSGMGKLDDHELVAAGAIGVIDPEDVQQIVTSGFDDGLYLSSAGSELTADQVRQQVSGCYESTGEIGRGYRRIAESVDARRDARKARQGARSSAHETRRDNRLDARQENLDRRLERRGEGSAARVESAQTRNDSANESNNSGAGNEWSSWT